MPNFAYKAITESGGSKSGFIEADSLEAASNLLAAKGYIPTLVNPAKGISFKELKENIDKRLNPVKVSSLILFTKQFRVLLRAGLPILSLLQTLKDQTQDIRLKNAATAIAENIKEGGTLYDSLKKHPDIFSNLYCNMVRAGETSGSLPDVLNRLTYIIEHEHKIKSDIKAALQYPKIVAAALSLAFFILLTFVIPKFISIFENASMELPLPTRMCMMLYNALASYWHLFIGITIAVIWAWKYYTNTVKGKRFRDRLMLKMPIFGHLFQKAAMARFTSIFAILNSSGVPLLESIRTVSGTIGNTAISREFDDLMVQLKRGQSISSLLGSSEYFPPLVVNMIYIGEETGNMPEMLSEISAHYDDEVKYAIKGLSEAITPILIVMLTIMVGFFALAIFLPMWDLTKMVKS